MVLRKVKAFGSVPHQWVSGVKKITGWHTDTEPGESKDLIYRCSLPFPPLQTHNYGSLSLQPFSCLTMTWLEADGGTPDRGWWNKPQASEDEAGEDKPTLPELNDYWPVTITCDEGANLCSYSAAVSVIGLDDWILATVRETTSNLPFAKLKQKQETLFWPGTIQAAWTIFVILSVK